MENKTLKTLKKLIENSKGQIATKINTVVVIIITVVVLFNIFASLVPEAQSAGDEFGDINTCSTAGGNFNVTQGLCLNGTSPADTLVVTFDSIPVNSLFGGSGVVILLLLVSLFLGVMRLVMPGSRK